MRNVGFLNQPSMAVNTCYRNFSHAKSLATSIVAAVLDIVTDAMSKYSILRLLPKQPLI